MNIATLTTRPTGRPGWWALVGAFLVPLLVAGGIGWATWNTSARLHKVEAAIVNLDKAVTINGQFVPLGRQLAAALVDESIEENFTWVLADAPGAESGLRSGRFAAVVTIPENFSAAATSYANATSAQQATISVTTSQITGVADTAVGQAVAQTAVATLNKTLTSTYLENLYVGFDTMGEQLKAVASGASQLATGAGALSDGLAQAATGSRQLSDGLAQAAGSNGKLTTGGGQLASGAKKLADGLGTLDDKAQDLPTGAAKLASGASTFAGGLATYVVGVKQLAEQNIGQVATVPTQLAGLQAAKAYIDANRAAMTALNGVTCADTSCTVAKVKVALPIAQMLAASDSSVASAVTLLQTVAATPGVLADPDTAAAVDTVLTQILSGGASAGSQISGGFATSITGLQATDVAKTTADLRALQAGGDQLVTGASQLASGAQQFSDGMPALVDGIGQLASGADALSSGLVTYVDGVSAYANGVSQAAGGAGSLADGLGQLDTGASQLSDGAGKLADGLEEGAGKVPSYSDSERKTLGAVVAAPISTAGLDSLVQPTISLGSLLMVLALWLGGMAAYGVMAAIRPRLVLSSRSTSRLVAGAVLPGVGLVAAQGLALWGLGHLAQPLPLLVSLQIGGVLVLAGATFAVVNHALVAWLGNAGRLVALLFGVVTAASALTYALPGLLDTLRPFSPLTPALDGIRAIASGGTGATASVFTLVGWFALALVASAIAVARSRQLRPVLLAAEV